MKFIGIIPARYASTRFPGKPLALIQGKTMIQRVYEQALLAKSLDAVYVATDDTRIENHVQDFGGKVIMTSIHCNNGTERCYEAIKNINTSDIFDENDVVINIQGDEPFINPAQIDQLTSVFQHTHIEIATLIKKINTVDILKNPNNIKVTINKDKTAIYFSRFPIPFYRDKNETEALKLHTYYKHIGIYAYKINILEKLVRLSSTPCEIAESLEQLRWIENGYFIRTKLTDYDNFSIDTPEDLLTLNKQIE